MISFFFVHPTVLPKRREPAPTVIQYFAPVTRFSALNGRKHCEPASPLKLFLSHSIPFRDHPANKQNLLLTIRYLLLCKPPPQILHFISRGECGRTQHRSAYFFYQQLNLTMGLTFSRLFERMVRGNLCVVAVAAMAADYFGGGVESRGGGWSTSSHAPITLAVPMRRPRPSLPSFLGDWDLERSGRWVGAMSVMAPSHPPLYSF